MAVTTRNIQMVSNNLKFSMASPFHTWSDFSNLNNYFEKNSLEVILHWSLATFGDKVAQVTSFGPTGMVILDQLAKLEPGLRVITLDTQFLFDETYDLLETIQRRYSIQLEVRTPVLTPERQSQIYGPELWKVDPDRCCHLRKVSPLFDVLTGLDGWFTGLRRDQSIMRANLPFVAWDAKYSLVKINPLASWTNSRVWEYIMEHKLPYNSLHDQGYASVGCTHCTRPTTYVDNERSGRWHGRQKTECGIHVR